LSAPLGGPASNAFGGDTGRGRTRQIPQAPAGPQPQAPAGPPPQAYAPQPQPQGYPQQPAPAYGQPAYGQPAYQQPAPQAYGQPPYGAPYPPQKQTSVLAILSIVGIAVGVIVGVITLGIFSAPFLLAGGVLGYLGMRETAYGRKGGRGMAVAGTITNLVLLVLNVGALLIGYFAFQKASSEFEKSVYASADGMLISERIHKYAEAKGDLRPGGPQFMQGYAHETAATGPQLTVADLVSPAELKNPITEYSLTVIGDTATVTWNGGTGPMEVGTYTHFPGFEDNWNRRSSFD
jgi:hypothetical protein